MSAPQVGERGTGGMHWHMEAHLLEPNLMLIVRIKQLMGDIELEAAMNLDIWVTALPAGVQHTAAPIYRRYADATGIRFTSMPRTC
eukprot:1112245-Amphidinium_carterae.1